MISVKPLRELPDKKDVDPFQFQQLDTVKVQTVDWLWQPYIPRGALTLIMGDGGYGKSWLTCAIAADVSQGRPLPGQDALAPMKVLMIGAEDGLSQVIKPKMITLDANMENIRASDRGFTLNPEAMVHLTRHIQDYDAAVVFLDPLVVYMGGKIDMFRANEARSMLTLLAEVAQNTNTAIVAVHHVRKSGEGVKQHKVMGSADFINGVRSGLLVDVSKGGQRYMAHVKSNWAANGPTLAYSFGTQGFEWMGEYSGEVSDPHEVSRTRKGELVEFLQRILRAGPIPAIEGMRLANEAGYPERSLTRAKAGLVRADNVGGMWMWSLESGEMERLQLAEAATHARQATPEAILQQLGRGNGLSTSLTVSPPAPGSVDAAVAHARQIMESRKAAK